MKRLHEYKRQQLNVLYLIRKYQGNQSRTQAPPPHHRYFRGQGRARLHHRQDIIHLILCLQQIIQNDPDVNQDLKMW